MTNMKKIEIKICMGTTCFIMCNSELQEIEKEINPAILPYIQILGSSCLGICKDAQFKKIPCATIDGNIIDNLDKQKLLETIYRIVAEKLAAEINHGK